MLKVPEGRGRSMIPFLWNWASVFWKNSMKSIFSANIDLQFEIFLIILIISAKMFLLLIYCYLTRWLRATFTFDPVASIWETKKAPWVWAFELRYIGSQSRHLVESPAKIRRFVAQRGRWGCVSTQVFPQSSKRWCVVVGVMDTYL